MTNRYDLSTLSDTELASALTELVVTDRRTTAELLAHLAEVDERRLYSRDAFCSMFDWCTRHLKMAEGSAYKRIRAARVARRFPRVLDMVAAGELHLSAVVLLSAHLSDANHAELFALAVHRSKSELERLLAERFPAPDAPALVRRMPLPTPASAARLIPAPQPSVTPASQPAPSASSALAPAALPPPTPAKPPSVAPTSAERFKIQFTASAALVGKLRRAQAVLSHRLPGGDLAAVCELALDALLEQLERDRFAKTERPRQGRAAGPRSSRHIPNAVKREVAQRDGMQCTFVDAAGRRCPATAFLEFHHAIPWALGGVSTAANVHLMCASHNREAAERDFGSRFVRTRIDSGRAARQSNLWAVPGDSDI